MFINNENFELASDIETDILLADDLAFNLVSESISQQIKDPLSTRTNFVSSMEDTFYNLDMFTEGDEDKKEEMNDKIVKFFQHTLEELDSTYGLNLDFESIDSNKKLVDRTVCIYSFLVLRYKKNMCKFLYSYITKNKKALVELFQDVAKRKDITTMSLKKNHKNKDMVLIVSNLSTIIKYILSLEIDAYDFIVYAEGDEYFEGSVVLEMVNMGEISDNFVNIYKQLIIDEYESVLDEIQNELKLKLLNK